MVIRETTVFTRRVKRLLDDESYRLLQLRLVADPEAGAVIRGTGGLRKIRWEGAGRGKRAGTRVVYYWARNNDVLLMLMIYGKSGQDDLTPRQRAVLRLLVRQEFP